MPTPTELAYFAGIVDGEGHVAVRPAAGGNQGIILCMADIPILEWCLTHIGGTLSGTWINERGNARPRRIWKMGRRADLEVLLPELLPYLVLKQAEVGVLQEALALAAQTHGRTGFALERDALSERIRNVRAARKVL